MADQRQFMAMLGQMLPPGMTMLNGGIGRDGQIGMDPNDFLRSCVAQFDFVVPFPPRWLPPIAHLPPDAARIRRPYARRSLFNVAEPTCWADGCKNKNPHFSCSRCLWAQYCSTKCQKAHWKAHKGKCKRVYATKAHKKIVKLKER